MLASERSCPRTTSAAAVPVVDRDPAAVPFADRDLVDPNHLLSRLTRAMQLLLHVLSIEILDRLSAQPGFLGQVLDRHAPATPSHEEGEARGVERIVASQARGSCFIVPHVLQWPPGGARRKPSGHRRGPVLLELARSRERGRCPTGVGVCIRQSCQISGHRSTQNTRFHSSDDAVSRAVCTHSPRRRA